MRRAVRGFSALICVMLLLSFCACSGLPASRSADPVLVFDSKARVAAGKTGYVCKVSVAAPRSAQLTLLEPKELENMTWAWNGQNLSVAYAGLTVGQDACVLPEKSFVSLMFRAFDAAAGKDALTTSGDGLFFGNMDGEDFTLTVDRKSGKILRLEIPHEDLRVDFES